MNWLDPIEELYDMYSEEEDTLRIVELKDKDKDLDLDIEGLADPYIIMNCLSENWLATMAKSIFIFIFIYFQN